MKRIGFLAFAILGSAMNGISQDYMNCLPLGASGNYQKERACIERSGAGHSQDPAYFYHYLNSLVRVNDSAAVENLMGNVGTFSPSDYHIQAARVVYHIYKQQTETAKTVSEPLLKNHKQAPVSLLIEVAGSFINQKAKDPAYTLQWIKILEKELKMPHTGWLMLYGDYFTSLGDYGSAMNYYNQVLDANPNHTSALYKKAIAYRRIKNLSAALAEIESALKQDPGFALAILEKAEIMFELNKPDEGTSWYNNYLEMIPSDQTARLRFGTALFAAKKYSEAKREAEHVLASDPKNISAKKLKAYSCYELSEFSEGLPLLEQFLSEVNPLYIHTKDYEYMARYYQKTGADSLAIGAYQKALQTTDIRPETFSEAGGVMLKKGRYRDAIRVYQDKLLRFPGSSADYYSFGRAALAVEEFALADSLFGIVTEMQPAWPNGFLMKANASAHLDPGSTEGKAKPYYEKYIQLAEADTANMDKYKNGLIESYRYFGYYYYLSRQIDQSKIYWNKVLNLAPGDKQAREVLQQL